MYAHDYAALVGQDAPASADPFDFEGVVSWPNAISLSGYAAGVAWLAGGPASLALWSVLADEFDGQSARTLGVESPVGDRLDHTVDVCLMALVGLRLGMGWVALPLTLLAQVLLKERGIAPPFGSGRAALMGAALWMGV